MANFDHSRSAKTRTSHGSFAAAWPSSLPVDVEPAGIALDEVSDREDTVGVFTPEFDCTDPHFAWHQMIEACSGPNVFSRIDNARFNAETNPTSAFWIFLEPFLR